MFEFSVAAKYLRPRWRQLSVSIISVISIFVIALVVWLIVVFFSVTQGLERSWIQKLISLTAPIRIVPTDDYYKSYYYHSDSISDASNYTLKSISEKLQAEKTDPYNPEWDAEVPTHWSKPDLDASGQLKDPVKVAFQIANNIAGVQAKDFENTTATLRLQLIRGEGSNPIQTYLTQAMYLGSLDSSDLSLRQTLLPVSEEDRKNIAHHPSESDVILHQSSDSLKLPSNNKEEGILLPKSFREAGALIGDKGALIYYAPTMSGVQEQELPVIVSGFYDPGIIPLGGKFALVNPTVAKLIRTSQSSEDTLNYAWNGINLKFDDVERADDIQSALTKAFENAGIAKYWKIETFREYEFTKDLIQQLRSERNLWMLIATVIIVVACSNIISMLIILVNDKKVEIGILRSMGASSGSIALIFGTCGVIMGMIGSIMGTLIAIVTLSNLQSLIDFIGRVQGYEMFNPVFYGNSLPNEVSLEALAFVIFATSIISLIAGIVPAIKATTLRPSTILRSE